MADELKIGESIQAEQPIKKKRNLSKKRRLALEQIRELYFVKKLPAVEISGIVGKGLQSVYLDIRKLKNESEDDGKKNLEEINNPNKFLSEMKLNYHMRIRKLWEVFNNCNPKVAEDRDTIIKVQDQIMKQEKFFLDYLQDIGAVSKKQDKPRVGNINYISLTGKERIALKGKQINITEGEKTNEENVIDAVVGNS